MACNVFFPFKENRKELEVKAEDCIGRHQLSHPGPPIGRLINKVLSNKRERCRIMEHNTFAMVIDPLLYAWVSVYAFQCRLVYFNLTPCSSLLFLSNLNISLVGILILQKKAFWEKGDRQRKGMRQTQCIILITILISGLLNICECAI